jgi:hypothetical protein
MLPVNCNKLKDSFLSYFFNEKEDLHKKIEYDEEEETYSSAVEPFRSNILNKKPFEQEPKKIIYCALEKMEFITNIDEQKYISRNFIYFINKSGTIPFLQFYHVDQTNEKLVSCEWKGVVLEKDLAFSFFESSVALEQCNCFISNELINFDEISEKFFNEHPECLLLEDQYRNIYESPVVGYAEKMDAGSIKKDLNGIVGPYYYFKLDQTYEGQSPLLQKCALFLGKLKVPMNFPRDEWDKSQLKKHILKKDLQKEKQTMRITDYDGLWTTNYDSVYLGKLELDDGNVLPFSPCWVIKNLEQCIPLL